MTAYRSFLLMKPSILYPMLLGFSLLSLGRSSGQSTNSTPVLEPIPSPTSNQAGLLRPPPDNPPAAPTPSPTAKKTTTTITTTASSPAPSDSGRMTRSEVARVNQQEIIRRQELIFRANEALDTAQKAELATDYPTARQNYLFAVEAYASISRATASYARAAEGLTRVDLALYDDSLKIGDTKRAKMLIDEALKYNPNNRLLNEKEVAINHALANPNDTSILGNPAINPAFVRRVNEVQQLFIEAEQFRRTGQWDEAEARLKRIIGIDPYNISATKQLERIDAEKNQYADTARLETRDERLRQVEEKWAEPINNKDVTTEAQEAQPNLTRSTSFGLEQALTGIFLSLDFNNASIEEATNFLSIESKRLDPNHKGVNFIIQPDASTSAKPISLTLNHVPLGEALRYVCQLANVKYKVEDYAISIVPFTQNTEDLISRTFNVPPSFVVSSSAPTTTASAAETYFSRRPVTPVGAITPASTSAGEGDTVQAALEAKGVKFAPGGSAVYTATTGQLTVVDTADQMELLEELVNAGQAPTLMVRIATKFVEINQTDLDDLTFNTALNYFANGVVNGVQKQNILAGSSIVTNLPGARGLGSDSIENLISPATTTFNTLYLRGFLNGFQYNAVIDALSQKKSTDLLSDPAVLVKSGEQGTLEAVREFPYPIAFDPPELVTAAQTGLGGFNIVQPPTVIATTPTDFKRRNVGVRLVIKPQVASDDQTVDLSLFPEVTQFDGFIDYGSQIFVGNPDGSQSLLSTNDLNQPVF